MTKSQHFKKWIQLIKSFINKEKLEILISEISEYLDEPTFNSIHGSMYARQSIYSRKKLLKFIPNVSRIRSINILEIAVIFTNFYQIEKTLSSQI